MSEAAIRMARTDWQSVALTLLLPLIVAGCFTRFALQPPGDDSPDWALGMLALLPLEFVRVVVLWILRDAYDTCHTPAQAVRFFLISLVVLAVIGIFIAALNFDIRDTFAALVNPDVWRVLVPPALLIAFDGAIALYFFRGDPHCQAARLDAQGDDAQDWLCLAIYALPLLFALCFVIYLRSSHDEWLPAWLPPGTDAIRAVCLFFVAIYFAGKGMLFAHVYSAGFQYSGARVLSARWVQWLLVRDRSQRAENVIAEAKKVARRRRVLTGMCAEGTECTLQD